MDLFGNNEEKSLYIIGNGFDLAHGMETSWGDFLEWLSGQEKYSLLCNWLTFYPGFTAKLWSNFEIALGEYDVDEQYEYCTHDIEIDYDHMMRSGFGIEDAPLSELSPITSILQKAFEEWIHKIDLPTQKKYNLPEEARYLSFNYTSVLEIVYGITKSQVFHIHGCADNDETLVFGHNNFISDTGSSDTDQIIFIENAKASIIGIMNNLYKDVTAVIEANNVFFKAITDIEHITVLGHSYNDIDMPYFRAISDKVKNECIWALGYHSQKDKDAAVSMLDALGIDQIQRDLFYF